jgi:hypothetical protein
LIYVKFAQAYHWTPDQVDTLTLRQLKMFSMEERELKGIGDMPRTKAGKKRLQPRIDAAVANLILGNKWDGRPIRN